MHQPEHKEPQHQDADGDNDLFRNTLNQEHLPEAPKSRFMAFIEHWGKFVFFFNIMALGLCVVQLLKSQERVEAESREARQSPEPIPLEKNEMVLLWTIVSYASPIWLLSKVMSVGVAIFFTAALYIPVVITLTFLVLYRLETRDEAPPMKPKDLI